MFLRNIKEPLPPLAFGSYIPQQLQFNNGVHETEMQRTENSAECVCINKSVLYASVWYFFHSDNPYVRGEGSSLVRENLNLSLTKINSFR